MGIFDFFKNNNDDDNKELDELEEIIFEDEEYDEWAEAGMIPNTDPGRATNNDDEDNGPDTEEIKHPWWWPF